MSIFALNHSFMAYEVKGKIYKIFPTERKTDSFQTREMVLETQDNYPQLIRFQLVQENCQQLDAMHEGMEVNVKFDLRGREWNGKFFTNLQAWRIETNQTSDMPGASEPTSPEAMGADLDMDPDGDLPF
jgi:hypothetical protein